MAPKFWAWPLSFERKCLLVLPQVIFGRVAPQQKCPGSNNVFNQKLLVVK